MRSIFLFVILVPFFSCKEEVNVQEIIDQAIVTHGGQRFQETVVKFDFRSKTYSAYYDNKDVIYTRSFFDDALGQVNDTLVNSLDFVRYVNGTKHILTDELSKRYANSVNSVLYFFQLPYGLNDAAVQKTLLSKNIINGHMYYKVKVTFGEEGGGEDFEDVFIYWVSEQKHTIDYLAYAYETNGGGLRFREATNRREIEGLLVQDYINYEPKNKSVAVQDLDELFETGQLKKLSMIESTNVSVINL